LPRGYSSDERICIASCDLSARRPPLLVSVTAVGVTVSVAPDHVSLSIEFVRERLADEGAAFLPVDPTVELVLAEDVLDFETDFDECSDSRRSLVAVFEWGFDAVRDAIGKRDAELSGHGVGATCTVGRDKPPGGGRVTSTDRKTFRLSKRHREILDRHDDFYSEAEVVRRALDVYDAIENRDDMYQLVCEEGPSNRHEPVERSP